MTKKLYELPRNTRLRVGEKDAMLHHVDGAYSYCTLGNGEVFHLGASTLMQQVERGVWTIAEGEEDELL